MPAGPCGKVPIQPELVELLRAHMHRFGMAPDGRLFRSESGKSIQPSTWWQVWQKVRAASLTSEQPASPPMKRPYDLRHSGITWRLNSGVPPTEVAAWAGHSVEMPMRVYARCVVGLEDVWIGRMDQALHLGGGPMTWAAHGLPWAAHGPQNPSDERIRWHDVSENDSRVICVTAGQIAFDPASEWRPQQDSNLRSRLRRQTPLLSATCVNTPYHPQLGRGLDAGRAARRTSATCRKPTRRRPFWLVFTPERAGIRVYGLYKCS